MIIFLQKLEIKSISDLTFKNGAHLHDSLSGTFIIRVIILIKGFRKNVKNLFLVSLVFLITNVKTDLVSVQELASFLNLNQFLKKRGGTVWHGKVELALGNLVMIKIS